MISQPKKTKKGPSISFNQPSLVTTNTVNVNGTNYRVFSIPGTSTPINTYDNNNPPITCSIYCESTITIYYLAVGSGGGGGAYETTNWSGGGGGGGGFLEGNFNLNGSNITKNIKISIGYGSTNTEGNEGSSGLATIIKNTSQTPNININAGGGGGGSGTGNGINGNGSGTGAGGGGGGASGGYSGGGPIYYGGNGGSIGAGGGASPRSNGYAGSAFAGGQGGIAISVASTTLGIYQKFLGTSFCGGGSGGKKGTSGYKAGQGEGEFGSGGGGGWNNNTSNFSPGKAGIVAIAISVNDIPP